MANNNHCLLLLILLSVFLRYYAVVVHALFAEAALTSSGPNIAGDQWRISRSTNNNNNKSQRLGLTLEIRPKGPIILGPGTRHGVTLTCLAGQAVDLTDIRWIHYNNDKNTSKIINNDISQPCHHYKSARCNVLSNGSLRVHKKKHTLVQKRKGRESANETLSNDQAQFRCIAHTSYGELMQSAPVTIYFAELANNFKESPKDLKIIENEVARLSCLIDSVPYPPNITWMHDGEIISTDNSDNRYTFIQPGVLYISSTKLSDAGSYRCVARNEYANTTRKSREAKLTIIENKESVKETTSNSTSIKLFPQSILSHAILNGSDLTLACAASGYPIPKTTWSFLPQHQKDKSEIRKITISSSNTGLNVLKLKKVTANNAGIYTCSMFDDANKKTESQNVTVDVLVPPSIVKKPANQICPNGRTARFECQAQGFPPPHIYWLRNAQNVTINGRTTVYYKDLNKVELAISATVPSDSGIYQCVAVNSVGEAWAAGRLQINASSNSPAAPTSLKCEARSPFKMFISWERPKLMPLAHNITAYTVYYRPFEGGKEEVTPPEPGNSTSVEVTEHLEPFTNYTFYVRLWNSHGASDQSSTITCATHESVPKTAPKISVKVLSGTKLKVTWKPLTKKEAQGIVTEYKLEWRLSQHPSAHVLALPSNVEQHVISDLTPGEKYDIRVLARTQQGWPNIESQIGWVTVTLPSSHDLTQAKILIINSTTLKLQWSVKENSILQFTNWRINCKNENGNTVISIDLPKNTTEYLLSNLEFNASYTIELCALNNGELIHCITKRADLKRISTTNAPSSLEAIPLSSSSISLSWLPGRLNVSDSFEVCYYPASILNQTMKCFPVNSTQVNIEKLKAYTLYQFKVRALNNDTEQNPFSEIIECSTSEDVPGKVSNIEWFPINNTMVRVGWKEPSEMNGIIQSYLVSYSTDKSESHSPWNNITVYGNKTSVNLPGLLPGKRYFVKVQASTKAGLGAPSNKIIILTGGNEAEAESLDEEKPVTKMKEDKQLGVILGIAISTLCIVLCLCGMYCRKKYEELRIFRESAQPLKSTGRSILGRNGNCCVDRSSTSLGQTTTAPLGITTNEIELAVLCLSTPNANSLDTKSIHANGIIDPSVKEPLLAPWEINGMRKDLHITENPQYKGTILEQNGINSSSIDLNSTQLTTCSAESLNNNRGPIRSAPILEPNG